MDAKNQYKAYMGLVEESRGLLDKGIATFLLKLPVPMSYEVWSFLHKVKGDLE